MDGDPRRFVDHKQGRVLIDYRDVFCGVSLGRDAAFRLERNIQLNKVPRCGSVIGLGALAVKAYGVFAKKFAHVADGKALFQKVLQIFRLGPCRHDEFLHEFLKIAAGLTSVKLDGLFNICNSPIIKLAYVDGAEEGIERSGASREVVIES